MNTEHFIAFLSVIGLALCGDSTPLKAATLPIKIIEKDENTTTTTLKPTAPPTTTTLAPKTTTSAPNTTTVAPSTTTTNAPTIPPAPAPAVQPTPGTWFVQEGNYTCIVAKLLINLNVTYPVGNGTKTVAWVVGNNTNPNGTQAIGYCGANIQNLTIPMPNAQSLTLTFTNTTNKEKYVLSAINFTLNALALNLTNSTNPIFVVLSENATLFPTPMQMSYKCDKPQSVNLTSFNSIGNFTASLNLTSVQIQAFRTFNTTKFGDIYDCEAIDTPDVVPIAVGCALIALVLVVLAAYLIGRHHSQSRGYMSM